MASNPCPGQVGGIPKLMLSDFKPVGCNVEYAATKWIHGVSTYEVLASNTHKIPSVTNHHKIQILWVQRKEGVVAKKRQRAVLDNL